MNISIDNFRVFNTKTDIKLNPLTVLIGTNSSGKSSLIKSLLLLKYNFNSKLDFKLETNLRDLKLGDFNNCLSNLENNKIIFSLPLNIFNLDCELGLTFKSSTSILNNGILENIKIIYQGQKEEVLLNVNLLTDSNVYISLDNLINKTKCISEYLNTDKNPFIIDDDKLYENVKKYVPDTTTMDELLDVFNEVKKIKDEFISLAEKEKKNIDEYVLEMELLGLKKIQSKITVINDYEQERVFSNILDKENIFVLKPYMKGFPFENYQFFPQMFYEKELLYEKIHKDYLKNSTTKNIVIDDFTYIYNSKVESFIEYLLKNLTYSLSALESKIKKISYIPINRVNIDRSLNINNTDNYFNFITRSILETVNEVNYIGKTDFIRSSLKTLGIADDLLISSEGKGSYAGIYLVKDSNKISLIDVGHGISMLMPVLFAIQHEINLQIDLLHNMYYGDHQCYIECEHPSILMIEEPEANLHPALQSKLADILCECISNNNIEFIIETHSEYFVRKLQYLIASKKIKANKINLYYFSEKNGDKRIPPYEITINEDGSLSQPFGEGFYDEATNLQFGLLKLKNAQKN